jgi:adsorption protein B
MLYELIRFGFVAYRDLPPIVVKGTLLWYLVVIDSAFMIWRILHRYITVKRVYGVSAALLGIVRLPVSNIINFSATGRALLMFLKSTLQKKELKWEKTKHHFPAASGYGGGPR